MNRTGSGIAILAAMVLCGCSQFGPSLLEPGDDTYGVACESQADCAANLSCLCFGEDCSCLTASNTVLCSDDFECPDGLRCNFTKTPGKFDGACAKGELGDWCTWGSCANELFCVAQSGAEPVGLCGHSTTGAECSGSWNCPTGHVCRTVFPDGKRACVTDASKEGELCHLAEFAGCAPGLDCRQTIEPTVCAPSGGFGVACYLQGQCQQALVCTLTWNICFSGEDYSPCKVDQDCKSPDIEFNCIPELGVCSSHQEGSACLDDCDDSLHCVTGPPPYEWPICQDGGAGAYCDNDGHCNAPLLCSETEGGARCAGELGEGEDCSELLPGLVGCNVGLVCNHGHAPPVCASAAEVGQPCAEDSDCIEGTLCAAASGAGICTDGEPGAICFLDDDCHSPLWCAMGLGQCVMGQEGAACEVSDDCGDGLFCQPNTKTCSVGGDGSPCTYDTHCPDGFMCVLNEICHDGNEGDLCSLPQHCQAPYKCISIDGKCHDGDQADPCLADQDCQADLLCVESVSECHLGTKDAICDSSDDCAQGLWCIQSVSQCQDGAPGSLCDNDEQCVDGAPCEGDPPVCHVGYDLWPCTADEDCQPGWQCIGGQIHACYNGSLADPCTEHSECANNLMCGMLVSDPICIPAGGEGAGCSVDKECLDGLYCFGPWAICFDGSPGDPCDKIDQCQDQVCTDGECK